MVAGGGLWAKSPDDHVVPEIIAPAARSKIARIDPCLRLEAKASLTLLSGTAQNGNCFAVVRHKRRKLLRQHRPENCRHQDQHKHHIEHPIVQKTLPA